MKGLYRYLSPFSSDQSGAAAVFYAMGGITIIVDAGGCAGNISGFDERRFFGTAKTEAAGEGRRAAFVFSACLRDMDAILGRDERLIEKARAALEYLQGAAFIAYIGTPVPAVIGTDFRALCRMTEKRLGISAVATDTTGLVTYGEGEEKAYKAIIDYAAGKASVECEGKASVGCGEAASVECRVLSVETKGSKGADSEGNSDAKLGHEEGEQGRMPCVLVFGATPLEMAAGDSIELLKQRLRREYPGRKIIIVGDCGSWEGIKACAAEASVECGVRSVEEGAEAREEKAEAGATEEEKAVAGAGEAKDARKAEGPDAEVVSLAVSPAGIKAARYMEDKCGIPYKIASPLSVVTPPVPERQQIRLEAAPPVAVNADSDGEGEHAAKIADNAEAAKRSVRRVLIIHQQCLANAVRHLIVASCGGMGDGSGGSTGGDSAGVDNCASGSVCCEVATFFDYDASIAEEGDTYIAGEDEFILFVQKGQYDIIIGDPLLRRAVPFFGGEWVSLPHWAVSGQLYAVEKEEEFAVNIAKAIEHINGR